MDCKAIRPLISYYYDGEATPEERVQVEQHLATCADCRQVLAQYRAMGSDIHELPMPTPPSGLHRDVWRAIEAQQASIPRWKQAAAQAQSQPKVVDISTARKQKRVTPATVLSNNAGGWARAVPAALVVAALGIMIAVLLLIQGRTPNSTLASLVDSGPFTDTHVAVQVLFGKDVTEESAKDATDVTKTDGTSVNIMTTFAGRRLTIRPNEGNSWEVGTTYQVHVDTNRVKLSGIGTTSLGSEKLAFEFKILANTPTPTNTAMPTATVVPTNTVEPTQEPTLQPTAVAQNTPEPQPTTVIVEPSATALPPTAVAVATDTPRPQPTNTPKPAPTSTAIPPRPSATPTTEPTVTATQAAPTSTATPTRTEGPPSSTPTPHPPTATPTPSQPCSVMPVNGFGLLWTTNASIRSKIGCPTAEEFALLDAVDERFEGGYMFWRGDIKKIYVFFGNPNASTVGTWAEYDDTWVEGEPLPTPVLGTKAAGTPPEGEHIPVRGFGKLWLSDPNLQDQLGWALEVEQPVTGAFQTFEHGYGLWTNNKVIRFMYSSGLWERYVDTFATPTPSPR